MTTLKTRFLFLVRMPLFFSATPSWASEAAVAQTDRWGEVIDALEERIAYCQARLGFLTQATRHTLETTEYQEGEPDSGLPGPLVKRVRHQEGQIARGLAKGRHNPVVLDSFDILKRTCETLCRGNIDRYENILHICQTIQSIRSGSIQCAPSAPQEADYVHLLRYLTHRTLVFYNNGEHFYNQLWGGFGVHEEEQILAIRRLINTTYPITAADREVSDDLNSVLSLTTEKEDLYGRTTACLDVHIGPEMSHLYHMFHAVLLAPAPCLADLQERMRTEAEKINTLHTASAALMVELGSRGVQFALKKDGPGNTLFIRENAPFKTKLDRMAHTLRAWFRYTPRDHRSIAKFVHFLAQKKETQAYTTEQGEDDLEEDDQQTDPIKSYDEIKDMDEDEIVDYFTELYNEINEMDNHFSMETFLNRFLRSNRLASFNPLGYYINLFSASEDEFLKDMDAAILTTLVLLPKLREMRTIVTPFMAEFDDIVMFERRKEIEERLKNQHTRKTKGATQASNIAAADNNDYTAIDTGDEAAMGVSAAVPEDVTSDFNSDEDDLLLEAQAAFSPAADAICVASRKDPTRREQPRTPPKRNKKWRDTKLYETMHSIKQGESVKHKELMSAMNSFIQERAGSQQGQGGSKVKTWVTGEKVDFHTKHKKGGANRTDNLIKRDSRLYQNIADWLGRLRLSF